MAQHTEGPWKSDPTWRGASDLRDALIVDPNGFAIADVYGTGTGNVVKETREANARLIAAAPEMLEALEGLFKECAMVHKHWGENSNTREADAAIAAAREVIKKARG